MMKKDDATVAKGAAKKDVGDEKPPEDAPLIEVVHEKKKEGDETMETREGMMTLEIIKRKGEKNISVEEARKRAFIVLYKWEAVCRYWQLMPIGGGGETFPLKSAKLIPKDDEIADKYIYKFVQKRNGNYTCYVKIKMDKPLGVLKNSPKNGFMKTLETHGVWVKPHLMKAMEKAFVGFIAGQNPQTTNKVEFKEKLIKIIKDDGVKEDEVPDIQIEDFKATQQTVPEEGKQPIQTNFLLVVGTPWEKDDAWQKLDSAINYSKHGISLVPIYEKGDIGVENRELEVGTFKRQNQLLHKEDYITMDGIKDMDGIVQVQKAMRNEKLPSQ